MASPKGGYTALLSPHRHFPGDNVERSYGDQEYRGEDAAHAAEKHGIKLVVEELTISTLPGRNAGGANASFLK